MHFGDCKKRACLRKFCKWLEHSHSKKFKVLRAIPRVVGSRFVNQTKTCVCIHHRWDELLEHTLHTHADAKEGQDKTNQLVALTLVCLQQPW